ncbi:hypothetical protein, partial [Escherichia coli]|uniref:hypothetical protein n=2 Tax=Enterobacteriaceae TaxID=543 RepID=UPI0013D75C91
KAERAKERRAHLLVGDLVLKNFDKSSLLRKFVKRVLQQEGPNSDVAKLFASQKPTKRETQQRGQTKLQRHKAEAAGSS